MSIKLIINNIIIAIERTPSIKIKNGLHKKIKIKMKGTLVINIYCSDCIRSHSNKTKNIIISRKNHFHFVYLFRFV